MPIYEFRCAACRKVSSVFQRKISENPTAVCSHCGSADTRRLVSQFAFHRSFDSRLDSLDDSMLDDIDENDPKAMAEWARRMGDQMGGDLPPDFDQMVDRMAAGEMPDDGMDAGGDDFDF